MKKSLLFIPFLFILFSGCDTLSQVAQSTVQQYGNPTSLEIGNGLKQAWKLAPAKARTSSQPLMVFLQTPR
jgi:hypothetical protein